MVGGTVEKVAFVLSGGGSRGAIEVGALLALLEQNRYPDILIGTSVGAINAAAIAINPTLEGAHWLENIWRGVTKETVIPQNYLSMVWRFVTGESGLIDNIKLRQLLESNLPSGIRQFADIKNVELYITAVDLQSGNLHIFGRDGSESIVDAVMASTALPPFLSPWYYRDQKYIDGGIFSDLPIEVAVEKHATTIYAIDVGQKRVSSVSRWYKRGILEVIGETIDAILSHRLVTDLNTAKNHDCIIHYIGISGFENIRFWDFRYTAEMIEHGKQVTLVYLRDYASAKP